MHGIRRRSGAGKRCFRSLIGLWLVCALLSGVSALAEFGADFDYLHTINPDIAGWLYTEDGLVNQAVLQGQDNKTYRKLRYNRSSYYYGSVLWIVTPARIFPTP